MGNIAAVSHASSAAAESPCPSLPMTTQSSAESESLSASRAPSVRAAATVRRPAAPSARSIAGRSSVITIFRVKSAPIAALTVRGLYTSAQSDESNSVPTPRAAAVLMTVPRLPGSRSDSNAMILPPRKTASHDAAVLSIVAILRILSIYFATVIIPSGDFSSLILSKAASESI